MSAPTVHSLGVLSCVHGTKADDIITNGTMF